MQEGKRCNYHSVGFVAVFVQRAQLSIQYPTKAGSQFRSSSWQACGALTMAKEAWELEAAQPILSPSPPKDTSQCTGWCTVSP
jgi:hypothetical protein